jgi:GT2 family glycosyltransferase
MAVDVVVTNHKTPDLLADFCRSYEAHQFGECTLTVVDVTLDSPYPSQIAQNFGADFISFPDNVGYGTACNAGAEKRVNDVILLANADTVLSAGLKECYEELIAHEDWGVLGPRQVDEHNRITAAGIFGTETSLGLRGWLEVDVGRYTDVREDAKSVSGSLYFIKRSIWQELTDCEFFQNSFPGARGAFLPTSHYYDETGCSYHVRAHGYKVVYYGRVKMLHLWHRASEHGGWADRQMEASRTLMRDFLHSHSIVCE